MRIYLAARYSRHPEMREVRATLESHGFTVTSRWIDCHDGQLKESITPEKLNSDPETCGMYGRVDVDDLISADCVVSYTGNGGGGKGGRYVEFGLAMGLRKRLVIVGPRENIFHCLPEVLVVKDTAELVDWLRDIQESRMPLLRMCRRCLCFRPSTEFPPRGRTCLLCREPEEAGI